MIASKDEMREEAIRRMTFLQTSPEHMEAFHDEGIIPRTIDGIAAVTMDADPDVLEQIREIEDREHVLVYYVIDTMVDLYDQKVGYVRTFLFVPEDRQSWEETYSLNLGDDEAIVRRISLKNKDWPVSNPLPEGPYYAHVHIKSYFGSLIRTR